MADLDIQQRFIEDIALDADYEKVASKYRPIFEQIAQGTVAREQQPRLPYEQINSF